MKRQDSGLIFLEKNFIFYLHFACNVFTTLSKKVFEDQMGILYTSFQSICIIINHFMSHFHWRTLKEIFIIGFLHLFHVVKKDIKNVLERK